MELQLSFRRLEIFRMVVDERGVTRAAEILMVAQPSVSAQLRALEAWVGAPLFARKGNSLVLTEAGEYVDRWAREVLAGAAQVRRDVGALASGQTGRVVIASSMAVGTYLLPPVAAALRRERPLADITVSISKPGEVVHEVDMGACDFAVVNWDERSLPEDLEAELLTSFSLDVYATPATVDGTATWSAERALSLPMVGAPAEVVYQRNLIAQLRQAELPEPHFVLRLGHVEAMKRAAIDNHWALIVPPYAVAEEVAAGRLVRVD
ncbi:MAG: LysR family transcriptional regulator, partial [Candidatus Dormibacteraeota bacterium]|nr:LysR family transcriptional regulator [Candidatus Dormibacteraeota bacterium]